MGQTNNVFLLVAIAALMAIATTVLAFLADIIPSVLGANAARIASDAVASATVVGH